MMKTKTNMILICLVVLLVLSVIISGCTTQPGGPGTTTPTPTITTTPVAQTTITTPATPVMTGTASTPQIRILSPGDVGIVGPDNFTVTIGVANFRLADALGQPNVAGEGHVHYFLDVEAPTTPGVPAIPASGRYVPTTNTSYTWSEVPGGFHTVAVELVNNDHTPLVPPAVDTITVLVGRVGAGGGGGGGGGGY